MNNQQYYGSQREVLPSTNESKESPLSSARIVIGARHCDVRAGTGEGRIANGSQSDGVQEEDGAALRLAAVLDQMKVPY